MALDVQALGVDLLSLSAHKLNGPPGVGALYVRQTVPDLVPLADGGGQERGLRPGTVPVPLVVGFGRAAALARTEGPEDEARIALLAQRLVQGLERLVPRLRRNGDPAQCVAGTLSLTFPGLDASELMDELPELALSSGAACQAESGLPSPVLGAIGLDPVAAQGTLRIGLGRFTTELEIERALRAFGRAIVAMAGTAEARP